MEILRTPDDRFDDLDGYPFVPHYSHVPSGDGQRLRVHHVDEGPADRAPVLLMHGEPSLSYLYRTMIPPLAVAGHRVVSPDLVGFGRSDKPASVDDYTYQRHVDWMEAWLLGLDLREITLFCQDWGGLIGLRLVAAHPDRFARVVVASTMLPIGRGAPSEAFTAWREFSKKADPFPISWVLQGATVNEISDAALAGYDAPFPDETYKAGAKIFPSLVPISEDDPAVPANVAAWEVLAGFDKPFLCTFSDKDPITRGGDKWFREHVPGAAGQFHMTIENGGHFLQEDQGPTIAALLNTWIG
jgi:haloalkane dehalogenase